MAHPQPCLPPTVETPFYIQIKKNSGAALTPLGRPIGSRGDVLLADQLGDRHIGRHLVSQLLVTPAASAGLSGGCWHVWGGLHLIKTLGKSHQLLGARPVRRLHLITQSIDLLSDGSVRCLEACGKCCGLI